MGYRRKQRYLEGELQQISKQGTPFWIDLKISLLNYEGKKILVFIGSDITLKKIFEDQIRFQGEKFKMALSAQMLEHGSGMLNQEKSFSTRNGLNLLEKTVNHN